MWPYRVLPNPEQDTMVAISLAVEPLSLLWKALLWRCVCGGDSKVSSVIYAIILSCSHSQLVWGDSGKKFPIDGDVCF